MALVHFTTNPWLSFSKAAFEEKLYRVNSHLVSSQLELIAMFCPRVVNRVVENGINQMPQRV